MAKCLSLRGNPRPNPIEPVTDSASFLSVRPVRMHRNAHRVESLVNVRLESTQILELVRRIRRSKRRFRAGTAVAVVIEHFFAGWHRLATELAITHRFAFVFEGVNQDANQTRNE